MPDINPGMTRFENGGDIRIGSDSFKGIVPGTLQFTNALAERIVVYDRANIVKVFEGDQQVSELRFRLRADLATAGGIRMFQAAGSSGEAAKYTIVIRVPNVPGGAAGVTVTFTNCWLVENPGYEAQAGAEIDQTGEFVFNVGGAPTFGIY